jgi:mannosyltransferase OCH1-like enzyme
VVESIEQPLHNTSIPHIMWFTYSHNILHNKKPSHFYENVLKTIKKYRSSIQDLFQKKLAKSADLQVMFIDNEQCYKIVQRAYPPLTSYFLQEKEGNFKSDICRVAALYLYGGKF